MRHALFGVLASVLLTLTPALGFAHGKLKSSQPSSGAHLSEVPREIRLTFTEVPELTFTWIELIGPDSSAILLTPPGFVETSRRVVVARILGAMGPGVYTVVWQMGGQDGHPVRDRYTFTIAPGAAGLAPPSVGTTGEPAPTTEHHDPVTIPTGQGFDAQSPLYVVVRWASFTALLLVIGAVGFHLFVLGSLRVREKESRDSVWMAASRNTAQWGLWATAGLAATALLRLYAQSYALHGSARALESSLIWPLLARTVWGWGWLLQVAGILLAVAGFRSARREGRKGMGWILATLGAAMLAFTPALSGHASSAPKVVAFTIFADGMHVIGAAGWLGSLVLMLTAGIPAALSLGESVRGKAVADLVNAFSPTALVFAGITAATGVFSAWIHVGTPAALWGSQYGKILLLKLAILSIMAGTGAYNWLRIKPSLGDMAGIFRIRLTARAELVIGVLVLIVTAVLVATPTPMDMVVSQ